MACYNSNILYTTSIQMSKQKQTVAIIGIGRVGLPLALVLADNGFIVYGIGRNQNKIETLLQGKMPFREEGIESLKKHIGKQFIPTTSYEYVAKANTIILTLGTPIDENMNPVLDQINNCIEEIIQYLKKGQYNNINKSKSKCITNI